MRLKHAILLGLASSMLFLPSCGLTKKFKKTPPPPPKVENFMTLADVTGRTSFKEDTPGVRVINIKSKAFIKRNDIRLAKQKALQAAERQAVDAMVRELLTAESYNNNYEQIETYFSKNLDKYIVAREVNGERKIYMDKFYGISASFKVNRQKVLVALQKDLRLINTSSSTLITVITSKKDVDLSSFGFKFSDMEDALMNQIQTDLNQRGLRAMDFRNAVTSVQGDDKIKRNLAKLSKEQFSQMISGAKMEEVMLSEKIEDAEKFYTTGLTLIKQLAKVSVEINILSLSKSGSNMVLNMGVTAKNISVGTGGAFANSIVQVARHGGANTDDSAMLTGLIKDAYAEMKKEFIPQVIKEMSTIDAGGNKLASFELVLKGFDGKDSRRTRRELERIQSDDFRYIDFDNTLSKAQPSMNIVFVRFSGKASQLGDKVMTILDDLGINSEEPIVAPGLTDLVFSKVPKREE